MSCLLCNLQFQTVNKLKDHFVNFHKFDPQNYLFKKIFKDSKKKTVCQNCFRCNDFLTTMNHKNVHNFLKHYVDGKPKPFED